MTEKPFLSLNIAVLTVSDSRTEADDKSGQLLVARLRRPAIAALRNASFRTTST